MNAATHAGHAGHQHADEQQHHPEVPISSRALNQVALSATLHCLTGCAIGEVLGDAGVKRTSRGFGDLDSSRPCEHHAVNLDYPHD